MWVLWIQSVIVVWCVSLGNVCHTTDDVRDPAWKHGAPYAFVERYATEAECEVVRSVKETNQTPTRGRVGASDVMMEHSWMLWCAPAEE
jgi:hypothetical protein